MVTKNRSLEVCGQSWQTDRQILPQFPENSTGKSIAFIDQSEDVWQLIIGRSLHQQLVKLSSGSFLENKMQLNGRLFASRTGNTKWTFLYLKKTFKGCVPWSCWYCPHPALNLDVCKHRLFQAAQGRMCLVSSSVCWPREVRLADLFCFFFRVRTVVKRGSLISTEGDSAQKIILQKRKVIQWKDACVVIWINWSVIVLSKTKLNKIKKEQNQQRHGSTSR